MSDIDRLLTVARAYAEGRRLKLSTVSSRALGDGKKLAAMEGGADIQVRRFEKTMQWFSDNWPDAPWPADIPRPAPSIAESAEARP
jgi:hypothetical protein